MSRAMTMTQQKMLCDLYQTQLASCSMYLLRIVQLLVLGHDSEKKLNDAEKMPLAHLHSSLRQARSDAVFAAFCEMILQHEQCRNLPTIITNLVKSYMECLQLYNMPLPRNVLRVLFDFVLRTCFEKPVFLHINDTRDGANLTSFRDRLALFYAECLLP